ncbi:MAG: L-histidine N(alpha)-methyltransferase, partial [Verrucomicrobiia bacterium]
MVQPVFFHPSEFPDASAELLRQAWITRSLPAKFHYLTPIQAHRWLAVHRAFSPSRIDPSCLATYDNLFSQATNTLDHGAVQLIGLGSGGGTKDTRFLDILDSTGAPVRYVPCDASPTLALISTQRAQDRAPQRTIRPLVADLNQMESLEPFWRADGPAEERQIFSLLGMVPNLEPRSILNKIAAWAQPGDLLVISANLAPGPDYQAGCQIVL